MALLTIFTPAYNRAHTIGRTYESLCRQTYHDFEWLIVDDGSSDNTRELVCSWYANATLQETALELKGYSKDAPWLHIHYIYQQNQGMHGAHNTAYDHLSTELNMCIDSDDYVPDNAVERIVIFWQSQSMEDRQKYAGIIGLDIDDKHKEVIGLPFPKGLISTTLSGYYQNGGKGDKKLVYRTDIIKQTPKYPIFSGENYVGLNYKYLIIDQNYELLVLNEPLIIVDYQLDGSSSSMYQQYWKNPKGWSFYRKFEMTYTLSLKRRFQVCIHYVSSSIICKNRNFIAESPCKFLTILTIPLGCLLYWKIKHSVKHQVKMKAG